MDIIYLIIGLAVGLVCAFLIFHTLRRENERLVRVQKEETERLRQQFTMEFENIATKIMDDNSQKFSNMNRESIDLILKPLGENLDSFRKRVDEVYNKESNERFSLSQEVKRLVELNKQISEEANRLTNALKGNTKTQGDWGEMILERILEQSGLTKGREYFTQEVLRDEAGNVVRNEEGSMMRPDVVVVYPDNRRIIIDSKVSLTAYVKYTEADDDASQEKALKEHVLSVRKHIDELSMKNYQDFTDGLDYVFMFVPNENAFLLAMQCDSELWNYAYRKRVVFISPTNLIASLKFVEDAWRREYHSQNAKDIANRGALMYDKFVSFVESLQNIGANLDKAQKSYDDAFKQLSEGNGNLVGQAEKLIELGVKPKKELRIKSTNKD